MAFITATDLSLGYASQVVINNLNFSVSEGNYMCIVGGNGSGKTTLMKTLLHLMEPLSGRIEIGDGLKNNEIGYLPQQTNVQKDFPASVKEIVISGCQGRYGLRPFYNKEDKALAKENMERMGITNLEKNATEICLVDNSKEFFWQGLFVRPEKYYYSMNRWLDWIL